MLEIGCGTGRALVALAERGVKVTGVDLSPVMVEKAAKRWGPSGIRFHCAEVLDYLRGSDETWDAVYSVFGAIWFTDPLKLLPLIASRLNPGGVLAFSQPPAIPGAYGPQGMYKGASPEGPCTRTATRTRPAGGSVCFGRPDSGRRRPRYSTPLLKGTSAL